MSEIADAVICIRRTFRPLFVQIFYPEGVGAWMARIDANTDTGGMTADSRFFPHGDDSGACAYTKRVSRAETPPATRTATSTKAASAPPLSQARRGGDTAAGHAR